MASISTDDVSTTFEDFEKSRENSDRKNDESKLSGLTGPISSGYFRKSFKSSQNFRNLTDLYCLYRYMCLCLYIGSELKLGMWR